MTATSTPAMDTLDRFVRACARSEGGGAEITAFLTPRLGAIFDTAVSMCMAAADGMRVWWEQRGREQGGHPAPFPVAEFIGQFEKAMEATA